MQPTKVLIWGIGKEFYALYNLIKFHEECGDIEILGYVDKNFSGRRILRPDSVSEEMGFEYIIVTTDIYFDEIVSWGMNEKGIDRSRFLHGQIFKIPHFNWNRYLQILEKKVSIIAEICYGGVLGKKLFLPMYSPFVNVTVGHRPGDYFKLLEKLDEYMAVSPSIRKMDYSISRNAFRLQCPELWYDDVLLIGAHFESTEEFFETWERRRKRYNKENKIIFAVLYDEEDLELFQKVKWNNKVGFFPGKCDRDDVVEVPFPIEEAVGKHAYSYRSYINNVILGEDKIFLYLDIFKLLNGEKDYIL